MSMTNEERLECLIDHCNAVIEKYTHAINESGYREDMSDTYFETWDDFVDALENIEEGMR